MRKTKFYIFLLLAACIFLLSSCSFLGFLNPETCPPHTDEDGNDICDICDELLSSDPPADFIPDLSGISFSDQSFSYDGSEHSIYVTGELPEGVSVVYEGNGKTDAGSYSVVAKFSYNGKALAGSDKTATLTIAKADCDMSGVRLISVTKTYDGIEVTPTLSGELPEGVSASIVIKNSLAETVDKIVDVGVYTLYAIFTTDNQNYYPIDPISATITINAPQIEGVRFEDLTVTYDGAPHSITVSGELPEGVSVVYEGGDRTAVGTYQITAKFYVGEVELEEERLTATLTINKATIDMSGVSVSDSAASYNGAAHTPTVIGKLPAGVEVVYTYENSAGQAVSEIVNAGSYKVTATFVYDSANYNAINPMYFTYTVVAAGFDVDGMYPASLTKVYDGVSVKPVLAGAIPSFAEVVYTYTDASGNRIDEIVNVGEYTVVASFVYDETNYDPIDPITFVYTVTKGSYDISGVTLESTTKTYDGTAVDISIGTLPEGLTASITIKNALGQTVAEMLNAGTYTVSASFNGDFDNYYPVSDISATVVIEKASIGGISFADAVFGYDGEEKSIYVTGAPSWLTVTYTGNGISAPGTHTVVASFDVGENYLPIAPMQAKIIIEIDNSVPTDGIIFSEYNDGYEVVGAAPDASVIIIPSTYNGKPVLSVKSFAFDGNDKLLYAYIPSSVVNIGNKAFADCTALATVEFGNIKVIGQQAFKNTAIKEISLPASLESIGFGAFEGTSLEKITLPFVGGSRNSSNEYFGFIFGGSTYAANAVKVPATLTTVTLANGCTTVPSRAFYGIASISEVVLGHTVTEIGNGAFQGCSSLRSVYIPATATNIPANAKAENGPFYGTASDMMIVVESVGTAGAWGRYYAHISDDETALVIFNKTYDDYVMNKENYRVSDSTDATLAGLFVDGQPLTGFSPSVYEYTLNASINSGLPLISAIAAASGASLTVEQASTSNGNIATITVVSMNGENTTVYNIRFNVTGSFSTSAEVVNKDGAKGTVSFIVDDGYTPTATFMKSMMNKYEKLAVSYALKTQSLILADVEGYTTDKGLIVSDIDNDGMKEYVLDENGKYNYVRNEEAIDFWRDIISVGRSEIIAHSHTHAFWGVNDEGGAQLTASTSGSISTRIYSSLAEGSATKEVYASIQIIKDIFGGTSAASTYVNAGIPPREGDTTVTEEVKVYLSKQTVRVLNDTKVSVVNGKVYLEELTWINLQSTVGTLPANTDIVTTADVSSGVIPAGTAIYLASDYITIPTTDQNGNQNVVKGFKSYIYDIYAQAYEDGTMIGGRTSGQKVYNASDFLNIQNRILRSAYIISTSTNDPEMPASWKKHIDNAIAANGGWSSFCIHAMTEDISEEGQGGHKITWEQAEALFSYACSKGDDLWIATQTDATMYYHQWSTSTVSANYDASSESISVSLTDRERDDLYTMELTVKVTVPGNWASATVNSESLTIRTADDGSSFVYVDVAPETTVSIIGG